MNKTLLSAMLLLPCVCGAQQTDVLFIGNSYTYVNDLPNLFKQIALSMGDTVNVSSSAPGGYTFESHASYAPTLAAINQQAWDYVVLQEQSQRPSFPPEQVAQQCYPYATQLVDSIRANDSCTQPVFYMTWGRQNGDASNCASWPPVCTYDGMQQRLRESYLEMAIENNAFASPVGVAWNHVRDTHPLINLYDADESHPSAEGSYLAASVFYCTVFRTSCVPASFNFSLHADTAAILREIASTTVLDSLATWNIGVNDPDAGFTYTDLGSHEAVFYTNQNGEHIWLFLNNPFSTEGSPIHQFPSIGEWTVTHVLTDACGRTDSSTQVIDLNFTGAIDLWFPEPAYSALLAGHEQLKLSGATGTETLVLTDMTGRQVAWYVNVTESKSYACPNGIFGWRIVTREGSGYSGLIFVP